MFPRNRCAIFLVSVILLHLWWARPLPQGKFVLLYVYEANSQGPVQAQQEAITAKSLPLVRVEGRTVHTGDFRRPGGLTQIALIEEVAFGGKSYSQRFVSSVLPFAYLKTGTRLSPYSRIAGGLLVRIIDSLGTVSVSTNGFHKTIEPGKSWSIASGDQPCPEGVFAEDSAPYQKIMEESSQGALASRLLIYNHGLFMPRETRSLGASDAPAAPVRPLALECSSDSTPQTHSATATDKAPSITVKRRKTTSDSRDVSGPPPISYWDFGDGQSVLEPTKEESTRHSYHSPGTYRVTHTKRDEWGGVIEKWEWLIGTKSAGESVLFSTDPLSIVGPRITIIGPQKWVTGRPAEFRVEVSPAGPMAEVVSISPGRVFSVTWLKPDRHTVRVAVTVRYRLSVNGATVTILRTFSRVTSVDVMTPGTSG